MSLRQLALSFIIPISFGPWLTNGLWAMFIDENTTAGQIQLGGAAIMAALWLWLYRKETRNAH